MFLSAQGANQSTTGSLDKLLVCGLKSLGQHCIAVLKDYDVSVIAIDEEVPEYWEVPEVPNLLEKLIVGDCRQPSILEKADIHQCRSVILVTRNERINIEAAFAARRLNSNIRLVVRSDTRNLNKLLEENLGNFFAFEPTQLSAYAFALTVLGSETIGYFNLEGQIFQVKQHQVQQNSKWCNRSILEFLNNQTRRILSHTTSCQKYEQPKKFYGWEPESLIKAGDTLTYIDIIHELEFNQKFIRNKRQPYRRLKKILRGMTLKNLQQKIVKYWQSYYRNQSQIRRVATIYLIIVFFLWFLSIVLYSLYFPEISIQEAFFATAVLLLGGYGDLFGSVKYTSQPIPSEHMPLWLRFFSLGLTLAGEAFVGVVYATVTDALLGSKFRFFNGRPAIPQGNHVVIIGLNLLGQRVAALLQELNSSVVGVNSTSIDERILPQMPIVIGDTPEALAKANLKSAKSAILVGDDNMKNLEIGLMVHTMNPNCKLVICSHKRRFSDNIAPLFPYAQVLCGPALSAEVFACAAFGEKVLSIFHLNSQIVMVTEYNIEPGDTLEGWMIAELAYGYDVVPILHQNSQDNYTLMPDFETRVNAGDRLIVLATSDGLQRIEWGEMLPRDWQIDIESALTKNAICSGAELLTSITGCNHSTAIDLMNNLPGTLPIPLYKHQAQYLARKLKKVKVITSLIPFSDSIPNP